MLVTDFSTCVASDDPTVVALMPLVSPPYQMLVPSVLAALRISSVVSNAFVWTVVVLMLPWPSTNPTTRGTWFDAYSV